MKDGSNDGLSRIPYASFQEGLIVGGGVKETTFVPLAMVALPAFVVN